MSGVAPTDDVVLRHVLLHVVKKSTVFHHEVAPVADPDIGVVSGQMELTVVNYKARVVHDVDLASLVQGPTLDQQGAAIHDVDVLVAVQHFSDAEAKHLVEIHAADHQRISAKRWQRHGEDEDKRQQQAAHGPPLRRGRLTRVRRPQRLPG